MDHHVDPGRNTNEGLFTEADPSHPPVRFAWPAAGLPDALQSTLDHLQPVIGSDRSAVLVLAGQALRVAASLGFPRPPQIGSAVFWLSEQPQLAELLGQADPRHLEADLAGAQLREFAGLGQIGAGLLAPLACQGRPSGLLLLLRAQARPYSPAEARPRRRPRAAKARR